MEKLIDGKCPKCGSSQFLADEFLAWVGSTDHADVEHEGQIHFYKCLESGTENVRCKNCAQVVDTSELEYYYD